MIGQHGQDGGAIGGGDGFAKGEVGGEYGGRLQQLPFVILDQQAEYPLAGGQVLLDLLLGAARHDGVDQGQAGKEDDQQQQRKGKGNAQMQATDSHNSL